MAKTRKVSLVDGYSALKAAQHAVRSTAEPPASSPAATEPADRHSELKRLGAHINRTAVPVKNVIECHECGYKFQLHGRASTTNCSKCRATLDLTDHTIDGKFDKLLKTTGTIRLTGKGVLESGELIANDFILEGTIEAGTVRAMRKLEIRLGARFSETQVTARDLVIAAGATIAFMEPAEFRDVEIFGTLRINLHASGTVTVRPGGLLQGRLHGAHLVVEDGGGVQADLRIGDPTIRAV